MLRYMKTELLTSLNLERAAHLLKEGEVVAFPTETVYGLGASVFDEVAVAKIFNAKNRPSDNPLIVHIADLSDLSQLVVNLSKEASLLMEVFFPGPLTLILPSYLTVPSLVRAGLSTVAIRMPALPLARELIRLAGTPLVAPSANLSGRPSSTTAHHVLDDLNGRIAAIIDGGPCSLGIESTILALSPDPIILRPGSIGAEEIERVLGRPVATFYEEKVVGVPRAPGMKYRHYAPKGVVRLFFSEGEIKERLQGSLLKKRAIFSHFGAEELYAKLREADAQDCEEVWIYCDERMQRDVALMNRLLKASSL